MKNFELTPDHPRTFVLPAGYDRSSVTAAFFDLAGRDGPLTPRHRKKIDPLLDPLFESLELAGRYLLLGDSSSAGELARPDGGPLLLFLIFVRDKTGLRARLTKMFDIYYYDLFGSAFIAEGIRTAKDALQEAARSLGCELPDPAIPGLGDCPLSVQTDIFRLLAPEDLGIRLLESGLMSPINSYTCLYPLKALPPL